MFRFDKRHQGRNSRSDCLFKMGPINWLASSMVGLPKENAFAVEFQESIKPMSYQYFPDVKEKVIFSLEGPQPQGLYAQDEFKVILTGLEAGQKIPIHPEGLAIYTFLEGNGWMVVDGDRVLVNPGAVVITQAGTKRGIEADSRLIFMAARISASYHELRIIP